ncbi:hypothetical protein KFE25_002246 [Diacronema lutheri]|uniref:Uncharacterized protein n=1 Tax=Diacronema lutheri TaxID=2081491 RepID=A0A8J6CE29_DIALT|nr:hypothetical protein KFE25_002246 [Diacronema lutheri]
MARIYLMIALALSAALASVFEPADAPLSRDELMRIAHDDHERFARAISCRDAGIYMGNKAHSLRLFGPPHLDPVPYHDYNNALGLLSPLLDGSVEHVTEFPTRYFVGHNTVTYLLTAMYECKNGVVSDNDMIISLRVDPSSRKVVEMYVMYFADRLARLLAMCRGDFNVPDERPRRAFFKELEGSEATVHFWEQTDEGAQRDASYIFAHDVVTCFGFLPLNECMHGRGELLRAVGEFNVPGGAVLSRRSVLHNNLAWLSLTSHMRCVDGTRVALDSEHFLLFDFSRCAVVRMHIIADEADVTRWLACTRGSRSAVAAAPADAMPARLALGAPTPAVLAARAAAPRTRTSAPRASAGADAEQRAGWGPLVLLAVGGTLTGFGVALLVSRVRALVASVAEGGAGASRRAGERLARVRLSGIRELAAGEESNRASPSAAEPLVLGGSQRSGRAHLLDTI